MKTIEIKYNYPAFLNNPEHLEINDALNELIFEVHHDFKERDIHLISKIDPTQPFTLQINQQELDLECHCQDDPDDCQCSYVDKIKKQLYKIAQVPLTSGCGCGGNCGCH